MSTQKLITKEQFIETKKDLEHNLKALEKERTDTAKRAATWYTTAERFLYGSLEEKRTILQDLGSNPVIVDGKLSLTPHPWVVPVEKGYKLLEAEYLKVRTLPEQMKKASEEAIRCAWLGMVSEVRTLIISAVAINPYG